MKKQFLFLVLLGLLCSVGNVWGDPTPGEANSSYLDISNYSTISTAGHNVSNLTNLYDFSSEKSVLRVSAYGSVSAVSTQKWVTGTIGNTSRTWDATGNFAGSSAYMTSSSKCAQLSSGKSATYKVTNCTKIEALLKTGGSSRTIYLKVYEQNNDGTDKATPVLTKDISWKGSNEVHTLTADELDKEKVYKAVVSNDATGNSDFYEMAFYLPAGAHTITKGSSSNGSITVATAADENEVVDIEATPNTGYEFTSWSIYKTGDQSTTITPASSSASTTFTMPAYGVTVTATFSAINYAITHSVATNGTYTIQVADGSAVSTSTTAIYGQTITLAATPLSGYELEAWNVTKTSGGSAVSMATANTFVMPAEDVIVAPTFRQLTCATPSISPADGSSFSGASQEITLACATGDATIHYTLDGSTPTALSYTYDPENKPVISSTTTIKAIAVKGGYVNSDVASATITKEIENVVASWDFTNEISSTDLANLEADETNWTAPTGSELRWMNKTQISGGSVISANSVTLQEFNGITFGGDIKAGNFRWMPGNGTGNGYLQLNGSNYYVTIPNLAVGDIITMSYKAAGSDDRYMTADKAELTSGTGSNVSNTGSSTDPVTPSWRVTTAGAVKFTQNKGLQIYSITVSSNVETVPVTKRDDRTYGTFVAPCGLDFSGVANMEAYIAKAINGTTSVSISKVTKVPAGTAFIVKTANPTVDLANVPVTTSATASDVEGNLLVAGNGATANSDYYYLAGDEFHLATEGTLQAGKAYLPAGAVGAPGLLRIVEGEQNATDIQSIESADKAVKFIENGRILILRDGITYDALGRIVK